MKNFMFALTALIMATTLPAVQAFAGETSLDSAIDTLQYRLTVEWDQKDLAAREKIVGDFTHELSDLQRQGVSDAEIFKSLSLRAFDGQTSKDIATIAAYAKAKKLGASETRNLVLNYANKSQKLGTSWSSEAAVGVAIGVIVVIILVTVLTHSSGTGSSDITIDPIHCYDSVCAPPPIDMTEGYTCPTYCY